MYKDCDKRYFKQPEFYRLTGGNNYVRLPLDPEHIWRQLNGMKDDRNSK